MDYFEKKQWIRIAVCAVLVILAVLAMIGLIGNGNEPLMYDPAKVSGAVAADAAEKGFGGDVTVHVSLDGKTVKALTIDTPDETEGLGKRASEAAFTDQFIGKEAPFTFGENGIEALSGATVTSEAALKAINRAAGADSAEPPAETAGEKPAEEAPMAEAAEKGFGGDVTVHVSLDGKTVKALTIDTPDETEGLGKRASEAAFTDQFIGKEAPFTFGENGIEALSGATVTSEAALKAINRAAGADSAEQPAETATDAPAQEPAPEATEAPAAPAEDKSGADGLTFGTYRSVKQNDFSTVTVIASTKNGKLTDVKIQSEGEDGKDLLTDEIREAWAKAILESGSAAPDAITGASLKFSAASVQEAMTEILDQLNGKTEQAPAAETEEEKAPEATEAPAAPAEDKSGADGLTFGTYRSVKQNDFSTVTVIASTKNGQLTDVKIQSEGEDGKDLLTDEIREAWAKAILESGSAAPDAITGASLKFSAASVQEAMTEILNQMNGKAEQAPAAEGTEEKAPEATEAPAAEEKAPSAGEESKAEKNAAEAPAQKAPQSAAYKAVAKNDFSTVTVIASAKNGQLTDVKILSAGEDGKDLLTDEIREAWAKAILESGSAAPDAITGASLQFSAASVQEAMTEILDMMTGKAEQAPAAESTEEKAPEAAEAPAPKAPQSAAYKAVAKNDFSTVTVIASAKNGQLTDVKILSEGEDGKDLLTDEIREAWAKAILESGSAAPDAITGASLKFSAASVQEAMTEILNRMAGRKPETAEETEAGKPAEDTEKPAESENSLLSLIAVSMGKEQDNSYVTDYLEQDPYLVNIYEGYGFAKDYGSARGHYYTLTDVEKTQRPHPKANCLTCKTPDMHKMIEKQGVSVYSMPFDEVMAQMTQPISCYTCHGADDGNGGKMVVTHQYVNEALGANVSEIKAASLSCGQCHIEYYFTPEDSETMMPYHSVAEMTPEAILGYYDELGFYDWEQPGTGTRMLKAQHPELETWSYGKHAAMLSCADCHMPPEKTEDGVQYHDHHLVSPLKSETLLAKCAACHGSAENTIALVQDIQAKVTARETEVGNKLSALKDELTAAVSAGRMSADELDTARKLHREAQWFFDFCYVENSEGAHNSELAYRCLDTAETKINEAMRMLASEEAASPAQH